MIRSLLRDESNQFRVVDDPTAISEIVVNPKRLLWVDFEQPSEAEFAMMQEEFDLHPLAIEDAMARHQRPKVDQYRNFYLVIFYSVAIEEPVPDGEVPDTRGLRGTHFYHPSGDPHPVETNGRSSAVTARDNHESTAKSSPWGKDNSSTISVIRASDGSISTALPQDADSNPSTPSNERIVLREISMFMGENYLITVHNSPIPELDEAARRWRRNAETIKAEHAAGEDLPGTSALAPQEQTKPKSPSRNGDGSPVDSPESRAAAMQQADGIGILLYSLLDTIVDSYFPVIDNVVERVEDLEEQIFEKYDQGAIESIFVLKKDLLALRKVLAPERDVLNVLIRRDLPIFEEHTLVYFQDVYDHVVRITDSIDTYRDLLSSALDSFLSMQSNRLNITVQTLTSVSIILMSIAAVTGWYGMNFHNIPELEYGYPFVIVGVAIMVILEWIFFKRKGWL
jgi:magnesium transporter